MHQFRIRYIIVNTKKTKYMTISRKMNEKYTENINLSINNERMARCKCITYLGV